MGQSNWSVVEEERALFSARLSLLGIVFIAVAGDTASPATGTH